MAQNLGFLNFGIDGDDKALKAKLEALKKDAISIEQIFKNIKLDSGGSKLSTDVQKAQLSADKLVVSAGKVVEQTKKIEKVTEQVNTEKKRGLEVDERIAKESAKRMVEVARQGEVELRTILRKESAQQKQLINEARLEGIRKRNELIGQSGQQGFKKSIDDANKSLEKQSGLLTSLEKKLIGVLSGYQLARYAKEIVNIRGEFQGLELAFTTMLGSAEQSRKMMSEITSLALETPYTVSEVANNTKQLIAMGIEADKVMATMKALGDVSAGLSVPMWRIAINYGQVSALGRLQAREIRDFAMAGVPIVEELAKQLGKTTSEITDMVSAGKIGFPEVEKAFQNMAGAGGKFHNMMEKQNSTVKGQMNRLEDQVQLMMNAIGKSNEGVIYGAIDAASNLVENYEKVGKVVLSLVATYGAYKGVLMASVAFEKAHTAIMMVQATSTSTLTGLRATQIAVTNSLTAATSRLNAAVLSNPYVLAASAIGLLAWSMWELYDSTSAEEKALIHLNNLLDQVEKNKSELTSTTQSLISKINSETESINAQLTAYKKLQEIYPDILKNMDLQTFKAMNATTQMKMFVESINAINTFNTTDRIDRVTKLIEKTKKDRERGVGNVNTSDILDELGVNSAWERAKYTNAKALNELEKYLVRLQEKQKQEKEIQKEIEETPFFTFEQQVSASKNEISLLNKELENLKKGIAPSTLKKGEQFDFAKGIEDKAKELKSAEEKLNYLLHGGKKDPSQTRERKDPALTKLEKQIDLLKTARQEYEKLSKLMGGDSAFSELKKNSAFDGISQSDLTSGGYVKSIDEIIQKVTSLKQTDETRKVLASLFTLKTDTAAQVAKENADLIEKELAKYKGKYDLYEYILGKTGNQGQAMQIAFGDVSKSVQTYRDKLKEELDRTDSPELRKKLSDQLTNIDVSDSTSFSKRMTDMIVEFQSVDDKITAIKAKGERDRIEIENNIDKANKDIVDARLKASQDSINKQVADLTNGVLQATESYQRLFTNFNEMSTKELNMLIRRWHEAIENAKKNADGSMTISMDGKEFQTTEKEIANFTKKILRSEEELRKRNPFKALMGSIDELNQNKQHIKEIEDEIESLQKVINSSNNHSGELIDDKSIQSSKSRIAELQGQLELLQGKSATSIQKMGVHFQALGQDVSGVSSSLASMFDAMGNEDLADAATLVGDLANSFSQLGAGIASGNPVQIIQGIAGSITSILNFHDKKLDKQIKRSQLEVKKLQGSYSEMSRFISRQLGAVTSKQAREQIKNLEKQQEELRKQQQAEEKKKKSDKAAIADYQNSIAELQDQIKYFYADLFSEEYGIDLKDMSEQLSNALVNAFKNGEDAALAFDNTVADIINDLASKMIALEVIQPAMNNIRDYLFGKNGAFKDGELSIDEAQGLVEQMANLKGSIGQSKEIWDALNEAAKKAGIDLGGVGDKNTLSKGIKEITEDTANLLASYINAIRADVAINREQIMQLVKLSQINQQSLGQMLAQIMLIQVNTFNTANNTLRSAEIAEKTFNLLNSATIQGGGTRFNID